MRFLAPLLRNVLAVVVAGALLCGFVLAEVFAPARELRRALAAAVALGLAGQLAAVAAVVVRATRPLRRAAAAGWEVGGEAALRAADAAHRLPAVVAASVGAASLASAAAVLAALGYAAQPGDLGVAAAGAAIAVGLLAAMLAYSLAAISTARASEALAAGDVATRGTVRGKILVLAFGLSTVAVLLLAATGYARYRRDVDREYVDAAARAQESAVAEAGSRKDAELVQHVALVTASPSALLGPAGVLARFGAPDVPFERARGAPPGPVRLEAGWLVTSRAPGGGVVASWLPEAPLWHRRRAFWGELGRVALVVYGATALLAWLAARAITLPLRTLGRAADRIASGDLTASPASVSRDEVGRLAGDFRRMAHGLKGLVTDVQSASEGVSLGAREAEAIGDRVRRGALEQHGGVVAVQGAVEAMDASVKLVARGVGGLSEYVAATTRAMGEMAAAFDEVQRKAGELQRAMDGAARDVDHLAGAGREAEGRLSELEALAGHAGGTLDAVKASMNGLERAAGESEATAGVVAEMAERAGGVVEETVHGIETLRAAVSDAHRRIADLGRRSDDIHHVVDFISEVAGRTNLLSLNASIIAAQAGEHGKAFAVVADQIRDLAAQIARSTKSIGDIIHAVREDVEGTAALIDRGDALAVEGVQLARNSLEAIGRIQRSTAGGRETAASIRAAVEAHAHSSREVAELVEAVAHGSRASVSTVQLVGRSVAGVHSVARGANAMAEQVARALEEQAGLGRRQMESVARLERMIEDIGRAVGNHGAAARRVREALQALAHVAGEHEGAVEGLSGVSDRLASRARALADSVGRFKV
ncbi:MAG TPA: HAMP domain-containing methyl-accepting chemotaxis protein [Anaeromyxobacter sp.]|nr:HAMP domain-containing methyl-accepting chemotaxis protein [Anaeromyxobacter sp.]